MAEQHQTTESISKPLQKKIARGGEGIRRTRIDFVPSKSGKWFLVVENEANVETSVEINLFVASP